MSKQILLPTLAILICHFLTGTATVCTRYLVSFLDPVEIAFLRYLFGGLVLLPLLFVFGINKLNKSLILQIVGLGILFFAVFPVLFSWAFVHTSAARGALVLSTMPIWTLIIGKVRGHEKVTGLLLFAALITIAGLATALADKLFSETTETMQFKGESIMLLAAIVGAIYSTYSREALKKVSPSVFTPLAMLFGCSFLFPVVYTNDISLHFLSLSPLQMGLMFYLGIIAGGFAFFLLNWALIRSTATFTSLFVTINPITAIILGNLYLDETIKINFIFGVLIVFTGLVMSVYSLHKNHQVQKVIQ